MSKRTAIQITIPEPCEQSWDAMTPSAGGRHCAHCQKTVVDFTGMTDATLLAYVQRNGLGCGRLLRSQVDRVLDTPAAPRRRWWAQVVLSLGLITGFAKEGLGQQTNAATAEHATIDGSNRKDTLNAPSPAPNLDSRFVIYGTITDSSGTPVINAVVNLKDSSDAVILGSGLTDFDGNYEINLDKATATQSMILSLSYVSVVEKIPNIKLSQLPLKVCHVMDLGQLIKPVFSKGVITVVTGMVGVERPWNEPFYKHRRHKKKHSAHSK